MKIKNNDKEFTLRYGGADFVIPAGDMDVADEGFASFIIRKSREWGNDVVKIGDSDKTAVKAIEDIKKEAPVEEAPKKKTATKAKK